MTKAELSKYSGNTFYSLNSRMGGKFTDIHCLTVYSITDRGTCKYEGEIIRCVANKAQIAAMELHTNGNYHEGRPSAKTLTIGSVEKLIKMAR